MSGRRQISWVEAVSETPPSLREAVLPHGWLRGTFVREGELLVHLLVIVLGYRLAYELRFDFDTPRSEVLRFWATLPLLIVVRLAAYSVTGVFRAYWQHFGTQDLLALSKGATASTITFAALLLLIGEFPGVPRSVLLLDWAAAICFPGGVAFSARCLREVRGPMAGRAGPRTLVIGVGERAEELLREACRDQTHPIRVVGLIDPGGQHQGRAIRGVRVLGTLNELPAMAARTRTELLVIAVDGAGRDEIQRVVERCLATGLEFKILPSLQELLEETSGLHHLRRVRLEDLLGRKPVQLNLAHVEADLKDCVVLITGAAGSIGSEIARQVIRFGPARVVLLDQAESELYFLHLEILKTHPQSDVRPLICDITDQSQVDRAFAEHRPEYVIHAAAYKHVPLMEAHVIEAVRNNVLGTLLIASAARRYAAKKMLLISTDKAINPSSVMGATKRIAERIIFGLPRFRGSGTDFRAVRFGNVLGSNGSVIPLFERQLAAGGPLTVTHPDVERYFMTIPEAVQLVLQAGSLPEAAGCISMLEMGDPVRILDLAEKLVRLSGRVLGKSVPVVFTGLRPGEKLREDATSMLEATIPTSAESVRLSQREETGEVDVERRLTRLLALTAIGDRVGVLAEIRGLVPECVPPLREWLASDATQRAGAPEAQPCSHDESGMGWHLDLWQDPRGLPQGSRFSPVMGWPTIPGESRVEERRVQRARRQAGHPSGGRRWHDARGLAWSESSAE